MPNLPLQLISNWENGTTTDLDFTDSNQTTVVWTETDNDTKLNVRHYTYLTQNQIGDGAPFDGAYAIQVDIGTTPTNDAYLNATPTIAADAEVFIRFPLLIENVTMATNDRFTVMRLTSSGTNEVVCDIRMNSSDILEIGVAETAAATGSWVALTENVWHDVELQCNIDAGAGNDGSVVLFLDGTNTAAEVTSLDQAAVNNIDLGVMEADAGTTAGRLLISSIMVDNNRLGAPPRFRPTVSAYKNTHLCIGPAKIKRVTLSGATADALASLYDTDQADLWGAAQIGPDFRNATTGIVTYEFGPNDGYVTKGLYAQVYGTDPELTVEFDHRNDMSPANIRSYALRR